MTTNSSRGNAAEHFKQKLQEQTGLFCDGILAIWDEIGVNESCQAERVEEALSIINRVFSGMTQEETSILHKLQESVKLARRDIEQITSALKLSAVIEPPNLPLMQLESFLESEAQTLRAMKKERMDKFNKLMSTANELCKELGERFTTTVQPDQIPAECELESIRNDVERLKFVKIERVTQAEELKESIKDLYEDLEERWEDTSLSRHLLGLETANLLSLSSLKDLENLHHQLERKRDALREKAMNLREHLEAMYARLDLQMLQLQQLLHRHATSRPSDIKSLEAELEKCMELRKQNIEKFVMNCRRELEQYWNALYISEDRKQTMFKPYFSTTYSETLLELHEAELEKTKDYYEKAKPILELFAQHCEVWDEFVDMERKANDPARLLARGRGKGLLQEQRQRREIERKIPKLEEKIKSGVDQWELEYGEPFLVYDCPIIDWIVMKKEELTAEKEALKRAKHEEKEREKEQEMRFGTGATKRGAGAMGGALQGGPKTPKKTKFGTTMNATHANNHTKFTSSSSSNKSKNVLLSAKKAPPVMQSQQNFPRPVNSGVIGQKAPLGKLTRQPNFGVQSGPLRGIGAIAGVVAGGSKIATIGLNPNQKAKRRSLAQLQKKKTEPAGPSKLAQKEPATPLKPGNSAGQNTENNAPMVKRRSRRIQDMNESRVGFTNALGNLTHLSNLGPNNADPVEISMLHETYSTFSNKIQANTDLASSMLVTDHVRSSP